MKAIHLFELKWLYEKYDYMLTTRQHIPNTVEAYPRLKTRDIPMHSRL